MNPDLEIDEARQNRSYVLGPIEAAYIQQGDTGAYSGQQKDELPEKISNKAKKLPTRLQDLIDDIYLFYLSKNLENTTASEPELPLDFHQPFKLENRFTPTEAKRAGSLDFYTQLGLELGLALRTILDENDIEQKHSDIAFGVVLSELLAASESTQEEEQIIEELLNEFEKSHSDYIEKRANDFDKSRHVEKVQKGKQTAREVLKRVGIKPTDERIAGILTLSSVQMESPSEPEKIPGLEGEFLAILEDNEDRFRMVCHMEQAVAKDVQSLVEAKPRGIPAKKLLAILFGMEYHGRESDQWVEYNRITEELTGIQEHESPANISNINTYIGSSKKHVTTAMRYLCGNYNYRADINWPRYKIAQEKEGKTGEKTWELTGYGKVVTITLHQMRGQTEWMYKRIFNNSLETHYFLRECEVEILVDNSNNDIESISDIKEDLYLSTFPYEAMDYDIPEL